MAESPLPWELAPPPARRWTILTGGHLGDTNAKVAHGVLRYGADPVLAVIDEVHAGSSAQAVWPAAERPQVPGVPVVGGLEAALELGPTSLLVGVAPAGGALPEAWRATILHAIAADLEIVAGLHTLLRDDQELVAAARAQGVRLWDVRIPTRPPRLWSGEILEARARVVAVVGTDCAIGKMTASLEVVAAARRLGAGAIFVATGQTGILIAGRGVPADHVLSDFLSGAIEEELLDLAAGSARAGSAPPVLVVEGQGSVTHPAYSAVTLGLLHGSAAHAILLCHEYGHSGDLDFPAWKMPGPRQVIPLYEALASAVRPARVAAVALNTRRLDGSSEARAACLQLGEELGLPCDDPVRFGGEALWAALR